MPGAYAAGSAKNRGGAAGRAAIDRRALGRRAVVTQAGAAKPGSGRAAGCAAGKGWTPGRRAAGLLAGAAGHGGLPPVPAPRFAIGQRVATVGGGFAEQGHAADRNQGGATVGGLYPGRRLMPQSLGGPDGEAHRLGVRPALVGWLVADPHLGYSTIHEFSKGQGS